MRTAFFRTLVELAEQDERIFLVVGDLGFGSVEPFMERFPDRFLNVGVAEQNLIGIAAGLALSGKVVFAYAIANFPTLRCLEQIRNDVCYHRANVKIVTSGGGFAYGALGMTHHVTEDLAIMRTLPEMVVVAPADPKEAEYTTRAFVKHSGPAYLRLGRAGEKVLHGADLDFQIGKAITVKKGEDITLISTGGLLDTVLQAAKELEAAGIRARVLSMHTIKPLDVGAVLRSARETSAIVTIEEHSVAGGLGGAVAEVLAEQSEARPLFKRLGIPLEFLVSVGDQEFLRNQCGLSKEGILNSLKSFLPPHLTSPLPLRGGEE